jgi:hypothetical protein
MKKLILLLLPFVFYTLAQAQTYKGNTRPQNEEQRLNDLYCTGLFNTTDGTILDVANSTGAKGYLNILDWLPGRVAGLQIYTSRTGVTIPLIRGGVPGVYLDEMPISLSFLSSLNVNDIAIVKVIKTPFYGGFNGGGGAIAIYTLGGEEDEDEPD